MKSLKAAAVATIATASLALAGCGSNDTPEKTSTTSTTSTTQAQPALPTAEELNAILAKASDPNVPTQAKIMTVQGGEKAPELFDVMTRSKQESGAQFQVVPPILPGYTADSVLATVTFTLPDREPGTAENVEFVNEGGVWKLSQTWACSLIKNTVTPEQVPPMCQDPAQPPAPAPAPEGQPAPAPAPEGQPAPAPAPAN